MITLVKTQTKNPLAVKNLYSENIKLKADNKNLSHELSDEHEALGLSYNSVLKDAIDICKKLISTQELLLEKETTIAIYKEEFIRFEDRLNKLISILRLD